MFDRRSENAVKVFCARACAAPLKQAVGIFRQQTGLDVEISVCSRHCAQPVAEEAAAAGGNHDFLQEIADAAIHDLAIGGAEYLLDEAEVRGLLAKGQRCTIACRISAIIVPAGNPAGIVQLEDLARPGVRIGISVIDCLKGLWEDVAARVGLLEPIRRNITFRANGCIALVEAVAQGKVDAAFGWSAFLHLAPERIQVVHLPPEQQVLRGTGVGMLSFASRPEQAKMLMDFLTTPAARHCYERFGWKMPE